MLIHANDRLGLERLWRYLARRPVRPRRRREAIHRRLGRRVAFKAVRAGASGSALERLEAEGETAARLSHPNVAWC